MLQKSLLHERISHQSNDGLQAHTEPALNVLDRRLQVCEDLDERPCALQGHLSYSRSCEQHIPVSTMLFTSFTTITHYPAQV